MCSSDLAGPECEHEVRVTYLKGKGWGIRVYLNEKLNQESLVENRVDIHKELARMLRMEDKCGNCSDLASASRDRNFCNPDKKKFY